MKQIVKLLTLMCRKAHLPAFALMALLSGLAAHADVVINETTFPDANFRNFILSQTYGQDGILTDAEIASVTSFNCNGNSLSSLEGIGYFTELISLTCYSNQLTTLDLRKNTKLTRLTCEQNQLTSLDVSNCSQLTYLSCWENQLTRLDVSNNTKLADLLCSNNRLTSLDLSNNTAIAEVECHRNQLTSLIVNRCENLQYLACDENKLTSLDVSGKPLLRKLVCSDNQITTLNVSDNPNLLNLRCSNNNLTALDMSNKPRLYEFYCANNNLTSLDMSNKTELVEFDCSNNLLTTLKLNSSTQLKTLKCFNNQLTTLDVSKNTALSTFLCYNNQLTEFECKSMNILTIDYTGQKRDLTAESAVTPEGQNYYYFRLDEDTDCDKSIIERMTETNAGGEESKFKPSWVNKWTSGGSVIGGQKRVVTNSDDIDPQNIRGNILLLTDVTEDASSNMASGTVTYTYKPYGGFAYFGECDFTLNWTAPIPSNPHTEITELRGAREAVGVTYTNLAGQSSDKPFDGINIVTTRYSDGTTNATKIIK